MIILHINNYLYGGGAETVFRNTIKILSNKIKKSQFVYASFNQQDKENFLREINNVILFKGNSFLEYKNKISKGINYIFSRRNEKEILNIIKKIVPDIIHIHGYLHFSPSILYVIKRLKSIYNYKVIETLHDYHIFCPNSSLYNYKKKQNCMKCVEKKFKYSIFFENCDYRNFQYSFLKGVRGVIQYNFIDETSLVDKYIVPSYFYKTLFSNQKINKKVFMLRNSIGSKLKIKQSILSSKTVKRKNQIVYFGRFSKEKNINNIIEAFNQFSHKFKDYKLIIIGEGKEKGIISKCILKTGNRNIILRSYLPQNEIFEILKVSKFSILASVVFENSPMSIIESLLFGCLPITSNIGGMKELSQFFNINLLFDPNDKNNMEEIMEYSVLNYEKIKSNVFFEKLYDFSDEIYLNKLLEIYGSKINKSSGELNC